MTKMKYTNIRMPVTVRGFWYSTVGEKLSTTMVWDVTESSGRGILGASAQNDAVKFVIG